MKIIIWVYKLVVTGFVLILTCSCEQDTIPVLSTSDVSNITPIKATCGGIVTDEGSGIARLRGVCWSTTMNPTIDAHEGITYKGSGTGAFRSELTGLCPGTKYYVKAFAINRIGTAYGNEVSFITTSALLPVVTTNSITSITSSTATGGGNIIEDSGGSITACGVVFDTLRNPTVETRDGIITEDVRKEEFISELTGLHPGMTYYVRAYVTNCKGTTYGDEVSFTTLKIETGTVTDIEDNIYKTVKIGNQWWMAENLRTGTYNDGIPVPKITDILRRGGLYIGAYCWYDNDSATYEKPYGKLYNWYAVNTGKLCPDGWHVPDDEEWRILTDCLGGEPFAGYKLKETGTTHWRDPNKYSTNETGFSALPGGYRFYDETFNGISNSGYWWSATENDYTSARGCHTSHCNGWMGYYSASKRMGFSVRCLKK
jgi:uncharacterized protein (TIGR02145 family)